MARFISILFHPLLMATYLYGIFMMTMPIALEPFRPEAFKGILILIFLVTFVLPVVNIVVFRVFGSIPSFTLEDRRDRVVPFIFITFLYILMTVLLYWKFRISITDNILKFLVIIDLLMVATTLVTFFYKVSVHSVGICGLLGIILPLNAVSEDGSLFYLTIGLIILAGTVMSSRLQLDAHTPREVMVGGVMGFAISFLSMNAFF